MVRRDTSQPTLFDSSGSGTGIEAIVRSTPLVGHPEVLNDMPFYGVNATSLDPFLSIGRDYALRRAYFGMNNFESLNGDYGVPQSVLQRMNTADIVALYIGIFEAKVHQTKKEQLLGLSRTDFAQAVSQLVSDGWNYSGIRRIAQEKKGFANHPTAPGSLIERMREIPSADREKFSRSLELPYRAPGRHTPELRYEFRNPFGRDEKEYDRTARRVWANRISSFMQTVYNINSRT